MGYFLRRLASHSLSLGFGFGRSLLGVVALPCIVCLSMYCERSGADGVLPVDVAELMLPLPSLQCDGNVKRATCRDGATDARHGNDRDIVE